MAPGDEPPTRAPAADQAAPVSARDGLTRQQKAKVGVAGLFGWLGIFGVGAALGAILGWQDVRGWVIGIVVAAVTVLLGFLLRHALPTV